MEGKNWRCDWFRFSSSLGSPSCPPNPFIFVKDKYMKEDVKQLPAYRKIIVGQFEENGAILTRSECIDLVVYFSDITDKYNKLLNSMKVITGETRSLYSALDGEKNANNRPDEK